MHRQGYDLQLTQYDERGWRATFYTGTRADECDGHRLGAGRPGTRRSAAWGALKK